MSCEWCKNADLGSYSAEVTDNRASISLAAGSCRFPKNKQFCFCPQCGEHLAEPRPLTLDELREREGRPVYIIDDDEPSNNGWIIWTDHHTENWLDIPGNGECCGTIWRAYDRPPKEAEQREGHA